MSTKYKATVIGEAYYITITTVGWIDIFTRLRQKYILIDALKHCQKERGLEIYAYCLMSSHLHMLCRASEKEPLSNIMRDFKKFTSKKIIKTILEYPESRREWMLDYFMQACAHLKRKQQYKVWQDGYHAEHVFSNKFIKQKIHYIHNNPVVEKIVSLPEDYVFSSARNYAELDNEIEVIQLDVF
ncbi:transposase [Pseudotenacibaculum sp. MALMAid0570]|uniref:REP-associated tyrosine transposase n=1 Tax=Pseudotenacibaculum sp. MALMAid0570 TaxID=3143938 RepID=UPI0032DE82D0